MFTSFPSALLHLADLLQMLLHADYVAGQLTGLDLVLGQQHVRWVREFYHQYHEVVLRDAQALREVRTS
ncbi:hypothetical protein A0H81_13448 [Grifola frondosa]|uniref:Uncharacterized protein n=1 Tax=Grifola frondosa TaxID=5627 RepID=A0A1C7LP53_GRIFR|nr:hypothetical protein A0H81_13448 [Grifola frondosa]